MISNMGWKVEHKRTTWCLFYFIMFMPLGCGFDEYYSKRGYPRDFADITPLWAVPLYYVSNLHWLLIRETSPQRQVYHMIALICNIKGHPLCVFYIVPGRSHSAKRASGLSSCPDPGAILLPVLRMDKY